MRLDERNMIAIGIFQIDKKLVEKNLVKSGCGSPFDVRCSSAVLRVFADAISAGYSAVWGNSTAEYPAEIASANTRSTAAEHLTSNGEPHPDFTKSAFSREIHYRIKKISKAILFVYLRRIFFVHKCFVDFSMHFRVLAHLN